MRSRLRVWQEGIKSLHQRGSSRANYSRINAIQEASKMHAIIRLISSVPFDHQRRLGGGISPAADCPHYLGHSSALALAKRFQARLLLELGVRAVRVVDELLVQSQRLYVHEPLAATVALDRSIKLQANLVRLILEIRLVGRRGSPCRQPTLVLPTFFHPTLICHETFQYDFFHSFSIAKMFVAFPGDF